MVIIIKNPALKKRVFRQLDIYYRASLDALKKGNLAKSNVMEKRADRLYSLNYNKIFKVVKK